jgi:acyl-CoA reductase-like NAD-dependent aldehyde dehydrogenase
MPEKRSLRAKKLNLVTNSFSLPHEEKNAHANLAPLVSFTGSERVGKIVGKTVMGRFGKTILELGGNNGEVVSIRCRLHLLNIG